MSHLLIGADAKRARIHAPRGYSPCDILALAAYDLTIEAARRGDIDRRCLVRQPDWNPEACGWAMPVEDALRGAITSAVAGKPRRAARYLRAARRVLGPYARNEWRACRALYRGTPRLDRLRGEV